MATSTESANATSRQGLLPVCRCGAAMRCFVANTGLNPKRLFWKCVNWERPISCKLYIWDDLLDVDKMPMVAVDSAPLPIPANNEAAMTTGGQCNCAERESKKIAKLKLKLVEERRKMKWMQGILVLVILYVAYHKVGMV